MAREPYLPIELAAIQEQLYREDGRFIVRLQWQLGITLDNGSPWVQWRHIRGSTSNWSAGSMEELLMAMKRVEISLQSSPGLKRQKRSNDRTSARCPRCGEFRRKARLHE